MRSSLADVPLLLEEPTGMPDDKASHPNLGRIGLVRVRVTLRRACQCRKMLPSIRLWPKRPAQGVTLLLRLSKHARKGLLRESLTRQVGVEWRLVGDEVEEGILHDILGRVAELPGFQQERRGVGVDQGCDFAGAHYPYDDTERGIFRREE